jgi:hypothetical protein
MLRLISQLKVLQYFNVWNGSGRFVLSVCSVCTLRTISLVVWYDSWSFLDYNNGQTWDQFDWNCLVARAAGQINAQQGQKVISVNQGVNQVPHIQREIDNAFITIDDANAAFGGTVWGITFTNEYIVDQSTGQRVCKWFVTIRVELMIKESKVVCCKFHNGISIANSSPTVSSFPIQLIIRYEVTYLWRNLQSRRSSEYYNWLFVNHLILQRASA